MPTPNFSTLTAAEWNALPSQERTNWKNWFSPASESADENTYRKQPIFDSQSGSHPPPRPSPLTLNQWAKQAGYNMPVGRDWSPSEKAALTPKYNAYRKTQGLKPIVSQTPASNTFLNQLRQPGQVFSAPGELDYRDTGALSGGQGGMQEIYDDILQAALLKIDPTFVNRTPFQSLLQNSFGADGKLTMSPGEAVAQVLKKSGLPNAGAGINYARSWDAGQGDYIQRQYDSARNT